MGVHLVIGGGEHSEAVTTRISMGLQSMGPVVRPSSGEDRDPVVVAIRAHLDRVFAALDLPAPVIADLLSRVLPPELPTLLRLAREVDQAGAQGLDLVAAVPLEVGRLLDLPQRIARTMEAFVPVVARWETLVAPPGVGSLPAPTSTLLSALREGGELLADLDEVLSDASGTALHLAAPAGPVGSARRADAEVLLALRGRTLTAVHPPGAAGTEYLPQAEPPEQPRVERSEDAWLLRVALPGIRAGDLELVRHDDELVLQCAGRSRRVMLPSVLRRCTVERAGVAGGVLTVTLAPDEAVWPRG